MREVWAVWTGYAMRGGTREAKQTLNVRPPGGFGDKSHCTTGRDIRYGSKDDLGAQSARVWLSRSERC